MGGFSLRLPNDLERKLSQEARLSGQPRSQLIRDALEALLSRRERERVVVAMVAAAKALAADPDARTEAIAVAADFLPAENEALDLGEGRAAGNCGEEAQDERWWH
jgi:predicted transcriptional regulator